MTPQSTFMIMAPVADGRLQSLRALLATMTRQPGMADPDNALLPFAEFGRLHVARFVVLHARTAEDIRAYGMEPRDWPPTLVFLGDCDGPRDALLADMVSKAGEGLKQVFAHCEDFDAEKDDLLSWMLKRDVRPSANYINWVGRTVTQIREEARLRSALDAKLMELNSGADMDARTQHARLLSHVEEEIQAGRLSLTPDAPTPLGWRLRNLVHKIGVPLILLAAAPLVLLAAPFLIWRLRSLERSDPEIVPRPDSTYVAELATLEDHDVTNQFSAFGELKPGGFRRNLVTVLLWLLDYSARHVYRRGYLTRVKTIHFARWVLLDGRRRVFFASNYDGALETYMGDFINKVAWGLNLVFSNGLGYPSAKWLIKDGAEQEQKFKYFLRRHQLPTEVWYKAYPGLTAVDLERNTRIRRGLEATHLNDAQLRAWLALI